MCATDIQQKVIVVLTVFTQSSSLSQSIWMQDGKTQSIFVQSSLFMV